MLERKCAVTGFVLDSLGEPVLGGKVEFWPREGRVALSADATAVISPAIVSGKLDGRGFLTVELNPGNYCAAVLDAQHRRSKTFLVGVPDTEAADFSSLVEAPVDLPPPSDGSAYDDTALVAQIAEQQAQIAALQEAIEAILAGGGGPVLPTLTTPLPDQSLTLGDAAVTLALGDYFDNASSYSVSPTGQGVTISGSALTISAAAERNASYTVTASNSTGQTVSDAFALVVELPSDWSITAGEESLVIASMPSIGAPAVTPGEELLIIEGYA